MEKLFEKANNEMKKLYDWFCANQLSLNPGKTKFIVFNTSTNKQISTGLKLFINDTSLTQVGSKFKEKSTTFLGIQIDESLSWKKHLAYINNKISHALFGIKQVKKKYTHWLSEDTILCTDTTTSYLWNPCMGKC